MSDIVKSLRINGEAWSNEASRDWDEAEHFITLAKVQSRLQHDAADHITTLEAELSRVKAERDEAVGLLGPFGEAAHYVNYYDGDSYEAPLYACHDVGLAKHGALREILNRIDGAPIRVSDLRAIRSFIARMEASK